MVAQSLVQVFVPSADHHHLTGFGESGQCANRVFDRPAADAADACQAKSISGGTVTFAVAGTGPALRASASVR